MGGIAAIKKSVAARARFITYIEYWFSGLAAVIERYQELVTKGTIPADPTLDDLITEEHLSLLKPFRNAVAHCGEFDDARILRLLDEAHSIPDWAERVARGFRAFLERNEWPGKELSE